MDVHRREPHATALGEDHQVVHQRDDSVHLTHDEVRRGTGAVVAGARRDELRRAADAAERVLHLVRDTRGDLTEGREPLALGHPLGQCPLDRAVAQRDHYAAAAAVVLDQRRRGDIHHDVLLEAPPHPSLALDAGAAGAKHGLHDLRDGVIRTDDLLDARRGRGLRRCLENAAGLGVHELDVSVRVDDDDAVEHGIEDPLEVGRHQVRPPGRARRRSRG